MTALHLVDATYELFRAWHALPSLKSPDGAEVGAVRGLLASMVTLLRDPGVTHVACATDHVIRSWRNDLFAGYKTGEGLPADLLAQFPLAEEGLRALGLVVWPMVEFEADDAVATAVERFGPAFERIFICSPDKDFSQLVDDERVVLLDRRRGAVVDEAGVGEKFGVPPRSIPDYLALVGDAADGLPGVPGWGAKSAAAVLSVYGTLEAIPLDPRRWTVKVRGAARLAERLAAHRDAALLYKRLATLRRDVPLAESAADLAWRPPDPDRLRAFCDRIGDRRLPGRIAALASERGDELR